MKHTTQITIYKNDNGKYEVETNTGGNLYANSGEFDSEYEAAKEGLIMFKK